MITAKGKYLGELRTENEHFQSGDRIVTDAPTDNQGRGEAFSPTDMLATAYATCMITIMGIKARDKNLNIDGASYQVTKIMYDEPRRVGEIIISIVMPLGKFSDKDRKILESIAHTCPVALSIHPDIRRIVNFEWK